MLKAIRTFGLRYFGLYLYILKINFLLALCTIVLERLFGKIKRSALETVLPQDYACSLVSNRSSHT